MPFMSKAPCILKLIHEWSSKEVDSVLFALFVVGFLANFSCMVFFNCRDRKKLTLFNSLLTLFFLGHIMMSGSHVFRTIVFRLYPNETWCEFVSINYTIHSTGICQTWTHTYHRFFIVLKISWIYLFFFRIYLRIFFENWIFLLKNNTIIFKHKVLVKGKVKPHSLVYGKWSWMFLTLFVGLRLKLTLASSKGPKTPPHSLWFPKI